MAKEGKKMEVLQAHSLRELVEKVNNMRIAQDDIVQIIENSDTLFLLYYK